MANEAEKLCVTLIGGCAGKTSLIMRYLTDTFPEDYIPSVIELVSKNFEIDNKNIEFTFWDTIGGDDCNLRIMTRVYCYERSDLILLCCSVDKKEQFEEIETFWLPELKQFAKLIPFIIVGTRCDLRNNEPNSISKFEALEIANKLNTIYTECSSLKGEGLTKLLKKVVKFKSIKKDTN
eukprot:TRINITY_DN2038_c2_g1_i2.p1 TRINITY_DN2038_c2_g1~~TRINITY_DN2038_c2_g1_i2.p1  ORF type:complete len:179 (-),score=64.97 TRINITY_DN2038_c2_g1_i2:99-635(-)